MQTVDGLATDQEQLFVHAVARCLQEAASDEVILKDGHAFVPVSTSFFSRYVEKNQHSRLTATLSERDILDFLRSSSGGKSYSNSPTKPKAARYALLRTTKTELVSVSSKVGAKLLKCHTADTSTLDHSRRCLADSVFSPELVIDSSSAIPALRSRYKCNPAALRIAENRLSAFNSNARFIRQDGFGKRIHSSVSCLNKQSRAALRWRDQPLVEIDISASQPTLLQALGPTDDFWNELCRSGRLYDWIAEMLATDREDAKERLLKWLFTSTKDTGDKRLRDLLRNNFPLVSQLRESFGAQGKTHLCRHLQKIEAELVLDSVAVPLLKQHPDSCILTIHDSLITTEKIAEEASDLLISSLNARGVSSRLKRLQLRTSEEDLLFS